MSASALHDDGCLTEAPAARVGTALRAAVVAAAPLRFAHHRMVSRAPRAERGQNRGQNRGPKTIEWSLSGYRASKRYF